MMALDYARKTAPLAGSNHIHKFFALENINQHLVADLHAVRSGFSFCRGQVYFDVHFPQLLYGWQIVLAEVAGHGLIQARSFYELNQPDLRGLVAILIRSLALRDHTWASLQHRNRTHVALVIEQLRHPDFLANNSVDCHVLYLATRASLFAFRFLLLGPSESPIADCEQ